MFESTIRQVLTKNCLYSRIARRNPAAHLKSAQDYMTDPKTLWKNVLRTDELKVKLFGLNENLLKIRCCIPT